MIPTSTYRLQIRAGFTLDQAGELTDYLHDLGVGAVYLSPVLRSADGSDHGYDVVDPTRIDPARGGFEGWRHLLGAALERGLGVVVDIVPNHLGVAEASENPAWWDVLRLGQDSLYATWFDIDWSAGRVRLPVLGDDVDLGTELEVVDGELRYYERRFPLAPGTDVGGSAAQVHDRQHYELVNFRRADTEQNYRRFFAVTTLAGLRIEDPEVFAATHAEILRWVAEDGIDGIRVDHPDGLVDPGTYFERLCAAAPEAWITAEKILEPGELLPDWPVDGTTGYDAMAEADAVFVDPDAEAAFTELYQELTGDRRTFAEHVVDGKKLVATTILSAEVRRLARLVPDVADAVPALTELIAHFPVYRSYLPDGVEYLEEAARSARAAAPSLAPTVDALLPHLRDPEAEVARRFQQASGAIMAKGVEDTAYYRYTRFLAANEVGGDPARFGLPTAGFHAAQDERARRQPRSMTSLSTHDTKRGEDVRARLAVLSEVPAEWRALSTQLMAAAPVPTAAFGYLLWQTFAGVGFIERDRMHAYAEKAMREAHDGTEWIDPDAAFETAVHAAVDAAYDDATLRGPLETFLGLVEQPGWSNALGHKLVQLTMPGVPDVYQGTELWEDSLVDPDNRRPVDYEVRRSLLATAEPPAVDSTGAAKLWVTSHALRLRRDRPELFRDYNDLTAVGPAAGHLLAFDRGGATTVATRLPVTLERGGGWRDTTVVVGDVADVLTGRTYAGEVAVSDLLATYPVALLTPR